MRNPDSSANSPIAVSSESVRDRFERPLRDLRLSLTDRCNLRCGYCMPEALFGPDFRFLPMNALLSVTDIQRLVGVFTELGVEKVRLTGGEPLLRPDVVEIAKAIANNPDIKDLALTTNGLRLARLAEELTAVGLQRVNVSLDAMDQDVYEQTTGRNYRIESVLKGIEAAQQAGLSVKINAVIRRGINESQILPLVREAVRRGVDLRFIEYMDVGNQNDWRKEDVFSAREVKNVIENNYNIESVFDSIEGLVARRFELKGFGIKVGFINSITEPFCTGCTRARVSATGKLFTCLFATSGTDLRPFLEEGESALRERLRLIWRSRQDRYSENRSELAKTAEGQKPEMWEIGG